MTDIRDRFRRAVIGLSAQAEGHAAARMVRRAVVLAGGLARSPADAMERLAGLQEMADLHERETATWIPPETLAEGGGGPFDACDLRHWLVLAERAGVASVPAREILVLDDAEISLASGPVEIPDNLVTRRVRRGLAAIPGIGEAPAPEVESPGEARNRAAALHERLAAAMDAVPEGWMVRSARVGPSELKALAGMGALGPTSPEVRFGPDLEVGPGWIRTGNRRRVNAGDPRIVQAAAQGPGGAHAFVARPWVEAARWFVGEDPHRHGTRFAGKGAWPAEWRAFVEGGRVTGVASYYGWACPAGPGDALMALVVRDLAQRIADVAVAQACHPRFMDVEFARANPHPRFKDDPRVAAALEAFGRGTVGCTLDFIETDAGPVLLEGGPANTPFGGGHPCAFAGRGGPPTMGNRTVTEGVALRVMPHVSLADPSTWTEGDPTGCIVSFAEAEAMAETLRPQVDAPAPVPA